MIDTKEVLENEARHAKLHKFLMERISFSEDKMRAFYPRWTAREKQIQAYIKLPDYERQLKEIQKTRDAPPLAVSLTIPYTYATIATIGTYLTHTFTGRKPMFQVGALHADSVEAAARMETLLQFNVDQKYIIKALIQYFRDAEIYGFAAMKVLWEIKKGKRTKPGLTAIQEQARLREETVVSEGNVVENIDPYMFFPDPRVPLSDVRDKGEFVFWRDFVSKYEIMRDSSMRKVADDKLGSLPQMGNTHESSRALGSGGEATPGLTMSSAPGLSFVQRDEGTVMLIPKEYGLSDSDQPERWIFTIGNKRQILRAEPFDYDHDCHPVQVVEPHTIGYGFGHLSTADYLAPLQDAASWFLNSHIYNVRTALNNMLVVNPSMIEMKDLTNPKPGKIIRLKRSAMGQDPRMAVQQLQITDVTRTHVQDLAALMKLGDTLSAVTDNLRGVQDFGGRRTATESRISGEAAASRLAAQARLYSAQAISPLGAMMSLNIQQLMTQSYELQLLGKAERETIGAAEASGSFYFPIHDGTLPLDKVALLDTWKEILMGVAQDPELRQRYSLDKIFEYVAELGGARNISAFKLQVASPQEDPAAMLQQGNAVPVPTPGAPGGMDPAAMQQLFGG